MVTGLVRLFYLDPAGNERTQSFCDATAFIGDYRALLTGQPSQIFIQTLEPSSLLVAAYASYQQQAADHGGWQAINRMIAEMLFVKKEQRTSSLLVHDATERYLAFCAEFPQLLSRVKQHHIASYLGITPESLSRIRAQCKNLNL